MLEDSCEQKNQPTSEIEIIGYGLFGNTWKSQIAQLISKIGYEDLTRGAVGSWHNRNKIPKKYKPFLRQIAELRLEQVKCVCNMLIQDQNVIDQCIDQFIDSYADEITPNTKIYTHLSYGLDIYENMILKPKILISHNSAQCDLEGWEPFFINDVKFQRQLIMLRSNLQKQFATSKLHYDRELDQSDSATYPMYYLFTNEEGHTVSTINLNYRQRMKQLKEYLSLVV